MTPARLRHKLTVASSAYSGSAGAASGHEPRPLPSAHSRGSHTHKLYRPNAVRASARSDALYAGPSPLSSASARIASAPT
eukprot:CAMPEP_0113293588 /NCGR_PEP_ID=MMETSP0008_2-20120614/35427_1 /TAXON_ID=97485 /ORGANISM="Prymnesium parvum" /LENGTH=79 /DNA_ID=CAMNT_0000146107 /DNA_START=206 /DNA_END=442 /DNA_ORIENTATION=+ /assembly_acc=CAM_ASM_000153